MHLAENTKNKHYFLRFSQDVLRRRRTMLRRSFLSLRPCKRAEGPRSLVYEIYNERCAAGEKGEIGIEATATATALRFKITDTGVAFAPTDAPDVDTSLTAEERQIGGLGIFLVRQLMDTINYERIDRKNVLKLTKKITS